VSSFATSGLLKRHNDKDLSMGAIEAVALQLDVSRSRCILCTVYRTNVSVVGHRRKDALGTGRLERS
jgi:hypothetical protein